MKDYFGYNHKICVVTGASSGIGLATAKLLVELNAEVYALDNVSFSVSKGEFVAIIGASGSGKSTLLHIIGGVDKPTSGSIIINGTDITKLDNNSMVVEKVNFIFDGFVDRNVLNEK